MYFSSSQPCDRKGEAVRCNVYCLSSHVHPLMLCSLLHIHVWNNCNDIKKHWFVFFKLIQVDRF